MLFCLNDVHMTFSCSALVLLCIKDHVCSAMQIRGMWWWWWGGGVFTKCFDTCLHISIPYLIFNITLRRVFFWHHT